MQVTTYVRGLAATATTALFVLSTGLALSCSSSGGSTSPAPTPTIGLTLASASASAAQGANATVSATVSRGGGFTGDATLSVEGVPTGVTGAVSNVVTSGGTTTATVTISVAVTTVPGTYNLTIRGHGTGVSDATAGLALTVTAAPGFSLTLSSGSATVAQGANAPTTATIARAGGFAGDVALTVEGAPTGVTSAVSNIVTAAGVTTATVTVSAALTTTPGSYNLTVRGHGTSVSDVTAGLALAVTAAPSYTLAVSPAAVSIAQNANAPVQVTLGRTNYTGAVTLALTGGPAGVTGVFAPAAPTGTTSTLTIAVATTVPAGQYPLSVRGTGVANSSSTVGTASIVDQSATVTLTVTPVAFVFPLRKQITITAGAPGAPPGYSMSAQFDHAALVAAGKALASGNDVRVFYVSGSTKTELDRTLDAGSAWNSATTRIWFQTQAPIGANGSDNNYYIYYGNAAATNPPADKARIFLFSDDFEAGNLNKWTQVPTANWAVSGTRAHTGAAALKYASEADQIRILVANPALNVADVFVESWWYLETASTLWELKQVLRQNGGVDDRTYYDFHLYDAPPFSWAIGSRVNGVGIERAPNAGPSPAPNSWTRVGSGIAGSVFHGFINGVEVNTASGLTDLTTGNIGFQKFGVPTGATWWLDDVVARRYVNPEPVSAAGGEQVAPLFLGTDFSAVNPSRVKNRM